MKYSQQFDYVTVGGDGRAVACRTSSAGVASFGRQPAAAESNVTQNCTLTTKQEIPSDASFLHNILHIVEFEI